jgi:hypothetical protein
MADLFGGKFQPMQFQRAFAVLTVLLCCLSAAAAQIMEVRPDGVTCLHSGLFSGLKQCGVPDWYAYAFVGSISSITPIENGESEIQVTPEELFHGNPGTSLTVRTQQGACLPKLVVGDHWLFFLRKENGKPIVLDYYGNDESRPVAEAQEKIEMLRRLQNIGDLGILRGHVQRGPQLPIEGEAVPNAHVFARRTPDNTQFIATTDAGGRYEFPPVPPGKYKLTVDLTDSPHADGGELDVSRGACWDLTFSLPKKTDGSISGHIGSADGKPFVVHPWVQIVSLDDEGFMSAYVDANGDFEVKGVKPGRYVVGVGIQAGTGGRSVPTPIYYPGVRTKEQAAVLDLRSAEKRTHIDFQLPVEDVLKPLGQATSKR